MVALTPRCAAGLGLRRCRRKIAGRAYIEVSGRKGFGVKADDLLDALIEAAKKEVDSRHPELDDAERREIATQIAIGALRYFMLKFTKQSVIAFDFKEALASRARPGRTRSTRSCARDQHLPQRRIRSGQVPCSGNATTRRISCGETAPKSGSCGCCGKTSHVIEQCIATTEPAYAGKARLPAWPSSSTTSTTATTS